MKPMKFTNITNEDFSHKFGGIMHTFPAGESTLMEDFKAEHFAKHLTDHILNLRGISTSNITERNALLSQILSQDIELKEEEIAEVIIKSDTRVKKGKKAVEKEFADLIEE